MLVLGRVLVYHDLHKNHFWGGNLCHFHHSVNKKSWQHKSNPSWTKRFNIHLQFIWRIVLFATVKRGDRLKKSNPHPQKSIATFEDRLFQGRISTKKRTKKKKDPPSTLNKSPLSSWWFFTTPFEKYARQIGSSSPIFGVKIPKIFELPPPSF